MDTASALALLQEEELSTRASKVYCRSEFKPGSKGFSASEAEVLFEEGRPI